MEPEMSNNQPIESKTGESDRNAFNAAFFALGFKWYMDTDAYDTMVRHSADASEQVHHYLETHEPHMLKAYDPSFLINLILAKKFECQPVAAKFDDWSKNVESKIGF
jgi:hypothetical protein